MSSPQLLSNRYEIGDTLGYGGMSEVHRGRDIRLGRDVAVKVLRADLARDPTFQLRFRREAQNAAALNHPAIVAVYDTGETDSENGPLPYIVMEFVDGRTLRDIVKSEGPLADRRAMEVMADASAALDYSHRNGIVHRDVKPANIMINESGAVKVMDFGIARAVADGQAAVTQTAAVIGTAQYLSPEQARGEAVDARSDVYASGCVLFELLTGEPPFTGDSPVAVAYQHVREEPRKPSDLNSQVPPSLDAVVLKALSKNPANRYQSAAEMRADLVRVLSGQRPKAPLVMTDEDHTSMLAAPGATEVAPQGRHRPEAYEPDPDADYDRQRKRRRMWMTGLITAVCVAVLALVAFAANQIFSEPAAPEKIQVPNVMGKTVDNARADLSAKNFNPTVNPCHSPEQSVGRITTQRPQGGTMVLPHRRTVTLCEGIGPEQIRVPDLDGRTVEEATVILQKAGLSLGVQDTQEVDNQDDWGTIIDWDNQGSEVDPKTSINVTVGKKPAESPVSTVVNLKFSEARKLLEEQGFTVERVEEDSDKPADTVIRQNPPGGSSARDGSTVTLVVSNGNSITMPSLGGMTPDEAEEVLKSRGWEGDINEDKTPTGDQSKDGKIVGTSPQANSKISKDQSITLQVGEYDPDETDPSIPPSDLLPGFR